MLYHTTLGENLKHAKKRHYPTDTMAVFALRIGVSKATYQKMEKGDLSVSTMNYYAAAELLGLHTAFDTLFTEQESLFDD